MLTRELPPAKCDVDTCDKLHYLYRHGEKLSSQSHNFMVRMVNSYPNWYLEHFKVDRSETVGLGESTLDDEDIKTFLSNRPGFG